MLRVLNMKFKKFVYLFLQFFYFFAWIWIWIWIGSGFLADPDPGIRKKPGSETSVAEPESLFLAGAGAVKKGAAPGSSSDPMIKEKK